MDDTWHKARDVESGKKTDTNTSKTNVYSFFFRLSQWDHVAMAVSLPGKTRLRFFESTIEVTKRTADLFLCISHYCVVLPIIGC